MPGRRGASLTGYSRLPTPDSRLPTRRAPQLVRPGDDRALVRVQVRRQLVERAEAHRGDLGVGPEGAAQVAAEVADVELRPPAAAPHLEDLAHRHVEPRLLRQLARQRLLQPLVA